MKPGMMKKLVGMMCGLAVVAGSAIAFGALDFFDGSGPSTVEIDNDLGIGGTGPATKLFVQRGGLSGGNYPMHFDLEIQATGVLTSARIDTATDANADGIIQTTEWSTVATASITTSGGVTNASCSWVSIPANMDGYRVVSVRTDIGTTYDEFTQNKTLQ